MSSIGDTVGYLIFGNPISQALFSTASGVIKSTQGLLPKKLPAGNVSVPAPPPAPVRLPLWDLAGSHYNFIRLAGLCGASAVIMGAYGKHIFSNVANVDEKNEAKTVFETANRFHFLHSFSLLAMPLVHKPLLLLVPKLSIPYQQLTLHRRISLTLTKAWPPYTGSLMAVGTVLFSGVLYYRALTGDRTYVPVATCGGFCLIVAWLTLIF